MLGSWPRGPRALSALSHSPFPGRPDGRPDGRPRPSQHGGSRGTACTYRSGATRGWRFVGPGDEEGVKEEVGVYEEPTLCRERPLAMQFDVQYNTLREGLQPGRLRVRGKVTCPGPHSLNPVCLHLRLCPDHPPTPEGEEVRAALGLRRSPEQKPSHPPSAPQPVP